jgi:chromosome segregation ATPase
VQATLGSAERQRERTQGALDDLAGTVDQLRKGAGAGLARGRRAIEDRRPATSEDIRELKAELRRIGRRLDAIEERLPAKRSASRSGAKRSGAKRSGGRAS